VRFNSKPLGDGLAGGVAVVLPEWNRPNLQGDARFCSPVRGDGLDRIELLAVAERHLDAEGAFGGEGTSSLPDRKLAEGSDRAVNNQFGRRHQPEGAVGGGHTTGHRIRSAHCPYTDCLNRSGHGEGRAR